MAKQYNPWTGFLEDITPKANDSKTCDGKNEYEIHYTVPGKNGTMVGSGKGTSEQEAKEDFMAYHKSENPTITKVKLYKTLDKAIRNCDKGGEVDILFYVDIDGNKVHETFSSNSAMNSRRNELKKHGIERFKAWSHAEWVKSESEFKRLFNQIKGSL